MKAFARLTSLSLCIVASACAADPVAVEPLDPTQPHAGLTHGEWGAAWWKWVYGVVGCDSDPVLDETGDDCGVGQSGEVWFLAGHYAPATSVERRCRIPAGRTLFVPIIINTVDNGGVAPADQLTADEAQAQATRWLDGVRAQDLEAVVDGYSIPNLERFRAGPTDYTYTVPAVPENSYECVGIAFDGTVEHAQASGYWFLLPPLSPGEHEISFRGAAGGGTPEIEDDFAVAATYHLTVGP